MTAVAILTPDPATGDSEASWEEVLVRLQAALSVDGISATPTPWTAHADDASALLGYDRVLPLLVWGYHRAHAHWLRACDAWRRARVALANPAEVLAWNSDKRYLSALAARGVAMPPTQWTPRLTRARLEQAFDETGAAELIVKPSVSGARGRRAGFGATTRSTRWRPMPRPASRCWSSPTCRPSPAKARRRCCSSAVA